MKRMVAAGLALWLSAITPVLAAMDFPVTRFRSVLDEKLAKAFPGADIRVSLHSCTKIYCGYELGPTILFRSYALPNTNVSELSARLNEPASNLEREAFAGACNVLLMIAFDDLTFDQAMKVSEDMAHTRKQRVKYGMEPYAVEAENYPGQRICAIYVDD